MRILIEEYQYTLTDETRQHDLKCILKELGGFENVEGKVSVNYVGYYYSAELKDCVFILPKVLITVGENKKELAFGEHCPEDIINIEPVDIDEISKWFKECISFQKSVIENKGIDICEESGTLYALMKTDDNEEMIWNFTERKLHSIL
jgi:hypothetical protein